MTTTARSLMYSTLLDVAKRTDPDGKIASIVELLSETNPILQDAVWKQGNLETGERVTVRTGLPTSYWRMINQGVPASTSKTVQIDEGCGMLEAWGIVDKDLAELNGNTNAFRMSEAIAQIESMNQAMADAMFYGNKLVNPEQFNGLSPRYCSSTAANAINLLQASGSGDDRQSIWLVGWGPNTVYCVYPKGSKAGITHENLGLQTVQTAAAMTSGGTLAGQYRAYQDHWQWKCGLVVKDWRYACRAAEIDLSALHANSSATDLTRIMISMTYRIPNLQACRPVFYMSRTLAEHLDLQSRSGVTGSPLAASYAYGTQTGQSASGEMKTWQGAPVMTFRGIPIRVCDALNNSETDASVA